LSESFMNQTATRTPHLKPRMWHRFVRALLILVAFGVGGLLCFQWFSSHELSAVMAELDRVDPGWRLLEIEANRKVVPDTGNSALHVVLVAKLQGGQSVIMPTLEKIFENLPSHVQLNSQQIAHLGKRFQVLQKAVVEARKLKDMPEGRYPIKYDDTYIATLLPHVHDARSVCELLQWDTARRVHSGDADGALESCLALANAARSMGDEPFLISLLVRYACNAVAMEAIERTLAQGHFTPASVPNLQRLQEL
jgi:hypothetical protein